MTERTKIDFWAIDWEAVDEGMRRAVQRAVWEHKQLGYPIYAMKDGKMQWIPPKRSRSKSRPRTNRPPMSDDVEYTESGQPVYRHTPRDREFEPAFGDQRAIEAIGRHVGRYVGKVRHVFHETISDLVHIDVHLVPPQPNRDFVTLVTSGMSDRPMDVPPDLRRAGIRRTAPVPAGRLAARAGRFQGRGQLLADPTAEVPGPDAARVRHLARVRPHRPQRRPAGTV